MVSLSFLLLNVLFLCLNITIYSVQETWNGEKYHKHSAQQYNTAMHMLSRIQFNDEELVLDLGCGTGKITADLAANYFQKGSVVGIDICSNMIEKAQSEYSHLSNISFQTLDATQMDFNQQFSLVVSFNVLHWIKDIKTAFLRVAQSLKSEGTFFAVFSIDDLTGRYSAGMPIIRELMNSDRWKQYFPTQVLDWNTLGIDDYRQALEFAGLVGDVECVRLPDWLFSSREDFIQYCLMIPLNSEIPQELKIDFINDFVDRYSAKYNPTEDGQYRFLRFESIIIAKKK